MNIGGRMTGNVKARAISFAILISVLALILTAACGPDPEHIAELFEAANRAYAKQDLESARAATDEILDLDPDHTNARILRGRIAYYQKDFAAAESDFQKARENDAASMDALLWLARAQSVRDVPDAKNANDAEEGSGAAAAIATLEALVEKDPGNPAAWYLLGTLYESGSEPQLDRAIAAYRYGLVAGKNLGLIHLRLAEIYGAAGFPDQARPHLEAALIFARFDGENADFQKRLAAARAAFSE